MTPDLRPLGIDADADDAFDTSAHLGAIRCPTLVLSGGRDLAYPSEVTRELVAGIAGARHVEYPTAGHAGPCKAAAGEACAFLAGWNSRANSLSRLSLREVGRRRDHVGRRPDDDYDHLAIGDAGGPDRL